ncbi:hypothetical protein [Sphaerotilus mobilis]|uniref:Helicase HerA central domain-containing protein n=1 Tax=Sphaerotilus mobilis TaxID=47994 RepID=A0A4Q7LRH9_9BURK|nr:hypothetical protein [Sphaerotilus mobilis]RZS56717.1 hypothetical protein EV685_1271 [Sphaerotilus mobilis]
MSVKNRPAIEGYIGASGSGKGVSITRRLAELAPARLVIWDPRDEYGRHAPATGSLGELVRQVRAAGPSGPVRTRYVPGGALALGEAFALVCLLVFEAGGLVFVAEELSDVTTASHAPPAWRRLITQGRHKGLHVIGAAQRPTLIDKTFLGNCTRVRCFILGYDADRRAMARELDCDDAAVSALGTDERDGGGVAIRYLERDRRARTIVQGRIDVSRAGRMTERQVPYVREAT